MAYMDDKDLEILQYASKEDLDTLVSYIIKDSNGKIRLTEELTYSDEYKKYSPEHNKYWKLIAAEIQCYGANTIMTMFRFGKGVMYREVLENVCDNLNIKYNSTDITDVIEMKLLENILEKSLEHLNFKERQELVEELDLNTVDFTKQGIGLALQTIIRMGKLPSYQIATIVANGVAKTILNRGLSFTANTTMMKVIGTMSGPIGWAISALWTVIDIAGPAYRITTPVVIQVAYIRAKLRYENGY